MTQRSKMKSFCFMAILGLILGVMAVFCVACNKESVTGITVTGLPENNVAVITDTDNTLQLGYDMSIYRPTILWGGMEYAHLLVMKKCIIWKKAIIRLTGWVQYGL